MPGQLTIYLLDFFFKYRYSFLRISNTSMGVVIKARCSWKGSG